MNLKKILISGAALIVVVSVGADLSNVNVSARHIRIHHVKKHSKRVLHNYYHNRNVNRYNTYKLHHKIMDILMYLD